MSEKTKSFCEYCGKEVQKVNLQDHEEKCPKNLHVKGLGGWLILVQISLILVILILLGQTANFFLMFIEEDFLIWLGAFLLFASVTLLLIYSLILMYKKKKEFPKLTIILSWSAFGVGVIISFMLFETIEKTIIDILKGLIPLILWTAYLRNSKRVKNTFVN